MTHPPKFALQLKHPPRIYRCEPGWRWSPPPLPDYDLWFVLEGEGEMHLQGRTHALRPGICFIVPPGAAPSATQNPRNRLEVFYVHFEPLEDSGAMISLDAMLLPPQGMVLQDRALFDEQARRCAAYAEHEGDLLAQRQTALLVEQMLLHLWEEAARPMVNPQDRCLREIGAAIRGNPGAEWSVESQAERACLSRSQYTRRFVRLYGISPTQFVIRCRLERASQLLSETDMTVSEVADVLGYRDLFFFSRQFKSHFGRPPGILRRVGR